MAARALALLGPTASGKSHLALALAERLPVEIVSMDSAQVYRGLDIGTAKPGAEERARVPHHLIDLVEPDASYSTGRWRSDALHAVQQILDRGKTPLIVGGTMLYYRALVEGLDALPPANADTRKAISAEAAERGWAALHADLARVDPAAAKRISPRDAQRIQRALEVWRLTGQPISALQSGKHPTLPFELRAFALIPDDREALNRRIAERFDAMLAGGLVEEVKRLRSRYELGATSPSMRAVGYRQVWQCLEGEIPASELREKGVTATRQLAKRQLTWLRGFRGVQRVSGVDDLLHSFL
ncbi:MAG TPA: tRNA (adenosine(37)-N6)-dimethylallyltransferase MiaA [Burkholderiales bacterium]|nr:tRNA (adenosine(37)-N6)-dimethylallyltransferase MiaA [Burkholderiales bacterium]